MHGGGEGRQSRHRERADVDTANGDTIPQYACNALENRVAQKATSGRCRKATQTSNVRIPTGAED